MPDSWYRERQLDGLELSFKVKKIIHRDRSRFQKIDIIDTYTHGRLLALDEKIMLTELDEFIYHEMIAHVPVTSHKNPKNVLIIGGGDGGVVREVAKHAQVKRIDLCEIDEKVVSLSRKYLPFVGVGFDSKKSHIFIEDGFKFLKSRVGKEIYDVIIVDSTDPVGMAKKLFHKSFYELAMLCLKRDGIIAGQCESPFFYAETIAAAHKDLSRLFNHVSHYTAPIPTYPSGYWSFFIASNHKISKQRKKHVKNCRFYNDGVHLGAFALPNIFDSLIKNG